MSSADKFFEQIFNEHLTNLNTSMPCEVVEYHSDEHKADIQPKFKRKKGNEINDYPIIKKAPILEHVGELETGDEVFVVFAQRALDYVGNRRHDLTDAVIIGKM